MKRKLTEVHMATADGLIGRGKSVSETVAIVAKQFGILPKSVQQYIESKAAEMPVVVETPKPPDPLFINKTQKGREGMSVMTEAGSMRVDNNRERFNSMPKKPQPHIKPARPNG